VTNKQLVAEIERLRTENEQLSESRRMADEMRDQYVDLYDCAPLAYLTLDAVGVIRDLNHAAADLLIGDDRRHRLVGTRLKRWVLAADQHLLEGHLRQCAVTRAALPCELHLRGAEPVQLWSRRIRPGLRLYPTAIIDLRDRETVAEETRRLTEAEKAARVASQAKDQFIAILSHELRTPLTPVLAAVTALQGRADVPPSLRTICEMIRRNVQIEARLIDDLLDVTRITQGKMRLDRQPIDVHEVVREVVDVLGAEIAAKHLTLGVFLEAERHTAAADALRLKQVFWNLLRNAVKFTPEGGRIELRSWNNGPASLHVEVSDNGLGFQPDAVSKLFEPFEQGPEITERNGGLGLGLAICRGVMQLHGGRIAASSRGLGRGARFVIEIETTGALPAQTQPRVAGHPDAHNHHPRILLVEDDQDTAEILGELLQGAGYEVHSARSVKAALASDLDSVDLVISDIGLPDASGLELMRSIRTARPLKGVALSGYGTEADIAASEEAGFSAHLTKPVDFDHLLETIHRVSAPAP
jgi:signal transduction histidine kinase/CheY-like chemotaxis protein